MAVDATTIFLRAFDKLEDHGKRRLVRQAPLLGVMGICLGGHLAFRAASVCTGWRGRKSQHGAERLVFEGRFYATDIDTATLGKGDDSLKRAGDIKGELLTVWGPSPAPCQTQRLWLSHKVSLDRSRRALP